MRERTGAIEVHEYLYVLRFGSLGGIEGLIVVGVETGYWILGDGYSMWL